jgi:hypothetical protein
MVTTRVIYITTQTYIISNDSESLVLPSESLDESLGISESLGESLGLRESLGESLAGLWRESRRESRFSIT